MSKTVPAMALITRKAALPTVGALLLLLLAATVATVHASPPPPPPPSAAAAHGAPTAARRAATLLGAVSHARCRRSGETDCHPNRRPCCNGCCLRTGSLLHSARAGAPVPATPRDFGSDYYCADGDGRQWGSFCNSV